jgi:hypothetical protein
MIEKEFTQTRVLGHILQCRSQHEQKSQQPKTPTLRPRRSVGGIHSTNPDPKEEATIRDLG